MQHCSKPPYIKFLPEVNKRGGYFGEIPNNEYMHVRAIELHNTQRRKSFYEYIHVYTSGANELISQQTLWCI